MGLIMHSLYGERTKLLKVHSCNTAMSSVVSDFPDFLGIRSLSLGHSLSFWLSPCITLHP